MLLSFLSVMPLHIVGFPSINFLSYLYIPHFSLKSTPTPPLFKAKSYISLIFYIFKILYNIALFFTILYYLNHLILYSLTHWFQFSWPRFKVCHLTLQYWKLLKYLSMNILNFFIFLIKFYIYFNTSIIIIIINISILLIVSIFLLFRFMFSLIGKSRYL